MMAHAAQERWEAHSKLANLWGWRLHFSPFRGFSFVVQSLLRNQLGFAVPIARLFNIRGRAANPCQKSGRLFRFPHRWKLETTS